MEQPTSFLSDAYRISGLIDDRGTEKAVVITHPHPLYGGDMRNPVVAVMQRVYGQAGFTTLRFDFRGVGASEGRYTDGKGEIADVMAALSHLADMGILDIDLAGYSFGAWVNAKAVLKTDKTRHMIMVSPPVAFMDFRGVGPVDPLRLVITGSEDDIAPPSAIQRLLPTWSAKARFRIIKGADHFYSASYDKLEAVLSGALAP